MQPSLPLSGGRLYTRPIRPGGGRRGGAGEA